MNLTDYYNYDKLNEKATLGEWIMACGGEMSGGIPALRFKGAYVWSKETRIEYNSTYDEVFLVIVSATDGTPEQVVTIPFVKDFANLSALYYMMTGESLKVKNMLYLRMRVMLRELGASAGVVIGTTDMGIHDASDSVSLEMLSRAV